MTELVHVNSWKWYLLDTKYGPFGMTIDYSEFPSEDIASGAVRDMLSINQASSGAQFDIVLLEFLKQFRDLESRWKNIFETLTSTLITESAHLQEAILSEMSTTPSDFSGEATVIALTLHCLVL